MKVSLNWFASARLKGPGVPGAGAGAWVSCLTILIGRARKGTLSGDEVKSKIMSGNGGESQPFSEYVKRPLNISEIEDRKTIRRLTGLKNFSYSHYH